MHIFLCKIVIVLYIYILYFSTGLDETKKISVKL